MWTLQVTQWCHGWEGAGLSKLTSSYFGVFLKLFCYYFIKCQTKVECQHRHCWCTSYTPNLLPVGVHTQMTGRFWWIIPGVFVWNPFVGAGRHPQKKTRVIVWDNLHLFDTPPTCLGLGLSFVAVLSSSHPQIIVRSGEVPRGCVCLRQMSLCLHNTLDNGMLWAAIWGLKWFCELKVYSIQ